MNDEYDEDFEDENEDFDDDCDEEEREEYLCSMRHDEERYLRWLYK